MNDLVEFSNLGENMELFDGQLIAKSSEEFVKQFRGICTCKAASDIGSIVYIWFTEKPIPRLRGESKIVYIGKTTHTFKDRHYRYATVEGTGLNWQRYDHIIKNFGPIRITWKVVSNPRETEKKLLRFYFEKHLELPPVNASS